MRQRALARFLIAAVAGVAAMHSNPVFAADRKITRVGKAMGTQISLTVWSDDEEKVAKAAEAVFREFDRVDRLMSSWLGTSDVSLINASAGGKPISVGDEVFSVLESAQQMSRQTGGAFDVSIGAFRGLWKFDEDREATVPTNLQIGERLRLIGWRDVVLDSKRRTVRLRRKGMRITLGGIAKGYAVDRAVKLLHDLELVDFLLQAGGDLYVSGQKSETMWMVGIRDPRGSRHTPFASAQIRDMTFSTSGDYERSFIKDGVRYHHILDPKTGRPARLARSVTVMAKDAITADAWSTSLLILGHKKGLPMVEKTRGLEAVFVDSSNNVHISSGLKDKLRMHRSPSPGI